MTAKHAAACGPATRVTVVGGGLAGAEAAWQLADHGVPVTLVEMRPVVLGPAHHTGHLAELVCSNSFKSEDTTTAAGQLKRELRTLGSRLMRVAEDARVPAGAALAVDRDRFASVVTAALEDHPLVRIERREATDLPFDHPVIVATGPLTSSALETALTRLVGPARLAFFDAAAPIVDAASIDMDHVFAASRYGKGDGADYLNVPLSREDYERFVEALVVAERVHAKDFESSELFRACQPIEEIARAGRDALRFGPMKPVGLTDPRTGQRPWAVAQLRAENAHRTAYNLVGFQTNLTFPEQQRVFRMLPGLERAIFLRYGVMHRNTFVDAPRLLDDTLALRTHRNVRIAGQLAGTEGYTEAVATGLLAALNTLALIVGAPPPLLPATTALGSLVRYATDPATDPYQPMHVNWGLVPPLPQRVRGRRERYAAYAERAQRDLEAYIEGHVLLTRVGNAVGDA